MGIDNDTIPRDKLFGAILGVAVGDALGVPVEFYIRQYLRAHPVRRMIGGGHHKQVPGTWSDDSSLTFCLADSLCRGYDHADMGKCFCNWLYKKEWTPHGRVFDSGGGTRAALSRIMDGVHPIEAGGTSERSNGNGSLMRIMPILFYVKRMGQKERFRIVNEVSSITHGHLRSIMACQFYIEMGYEILLGKSLRESYNGAVRAVFDYYRERSGKKELLHFKRILFSDISKLKEKEIESSGYVVHTLEASLWSLLKTDCYEGAVLKAVNLGHDTDTTGAVTGGLAGLYYGMKDIPAMWIKKLARRDDIIELLERMLHNL